MDEYLGITEQPSSNEAKYNIFRFQDHLLDWISISARYFQVEKYPQAVQAITNVYTDSHGFLLDDADKEELDKLYVRLQKDKAEYVNWENQYKENYNKRQNRTPPPMNIYITYIEFRKKLMELLTKKQLLIQLTKKSQAGAGSEI